MAVADAAVAACSVIIAAATVVAACSAIIATTAVAGCSAIIVATTVAVVCSHACTLARLLLAARLSPFAAPRNRSAALPSRFAAPRNRPAALLSRPAAMQLPWCKAAVAARSWKVNRLSVASRTLLWKASRKLKSAPKPKRPAPATTFRRLRRPMTPATLRPLRSLSELTLATPVKRPQDNFGLSADARSPQNEYNSAWGFFMAVLPTQPKTGRVRCTV